MKSLAIAVFVLLVVICHGRDANDARIVAAYSTRTAITLTTITSVQPYTCYLFTTTFACQKRRLRRQKPENALLEASLDEDKLLLDGTFDDPEGGPEGRALNQDRKGRIALTVWTTSSSTYTITSTSINTATTFSLSYYCSINGFPYAPACG
ncbi:uncharacterized protein [Palaemon carinicauda]|uniref:uncharacterized protein n=1 Tax=Palaemon carinicauda TaxID=392227 RepID=UPI0035B645A0